MRSLRRTTNILLIIVLVCFLFSIQYLINGSMEMFPTEEQQGKARFAALFLCIVFSAVEVVLLMLRLKTKRKIDSEK